ncbi:MAG: ATP-binding protein [bacterium]
MTSKIKILVVEDERIVGEDIKNSLKTLGYIVTKIVTTGEMALTEVEKNPPDIILMDIVLNSKMSGIDVAEKIKKQYDIPVIYLTAYADMQTLEKAKFTEPYGYILKPFNLLELQGTLEMALYKYKMEKKLRERNVWISSVVGSIADGVMATDNQGKVTFVNPIAKRLIGAARKQIMGVSIEKVLNLVDEKAGKSVEGYMARLLKGEGIESLSQSAIMISQNRTRIPVDYSIAPIRNDKGIIEGVVTVFRDITERKENEQALKDRYNFESIISKITSNFIKNPFHKLDDTFNYALKDIAGFAQGDCACMYIYSLRHNSLSLRYSWCKTNDSELHSFVNLITKRGNNFLKSLKNHETLFINKIEDFPHKSSRVITATVKKNFRPFILVPMILNNALYSVLGFFGSKDEQIKNKQDLLSLINTVSDIFINVLERRRAEESLKVSEVRYRGLFEAMHAGVIYFNSEKRIVSCNNSAEIIFGVKSSDMLGASLVSKSWKLLNEYGVDLRDRENPVDIAFITGKPVLNRTFTDVTQRKEMEFTLKARNLELEALTTIANIVSGTLDLKVIVNKALDEILRIMDFSKGCAFIYSEIGDSTVVNVFRNITKKLSEALLSYQEDKSSEYWKRLSEGTIQCFLTKEILIGNQYKFKNIPAESSLYSLLVPLKVGENIIGSLIFFSKKFLSSQDFGYYFFSNVGNQIGLAVRNARLYEKTNQTLMELEVTQDKLVESEKLIGFGEMASSVVHEIGNPLGSISNSIQVLKKKLKVDPTMKELIDIIGWEAERLTKSVEQLRELSKQRSYDFSKNDLRDIVKRGLLIINNDFELVMGKNIKTSFSKNIPLSRLDSDAMQQVVFNLVKNALQASEEGGQIEVILKTPTKTSKKHLILEVKDYGTGISQKDIDSIFEPYFSTKSKGMGLGMYVVKKIVEAHNGTIKINSKENLGTTVTVTIPVKGVGHG